MKWIRRCGPVVSALSLMIVLAVPPRAVIADDEIVQILTPPWSEAGDPDQPGPNRWTFSRSWWSDLLKMSADIAVCLFAK